MDTYMFMPGILGHLVAQPYSHALGSQRRGNRVDANTIKVVGLLKGSEYICAYNSLDSFPWEYKASRTLFMIFLLCNRGRVPSGPVNS